MSHDPEGKEYLEALEKSVAAGKPFRTKKEEKPAESPSSWEESAPNPTPQSRPATSSSDTGSRKRFDPTDAWQEGDLLVLDDGSVGIYKDNVQGKEYQLVYFLEPDGELKAQGVILTSYDAKKLGNLPKDVLAVFRKTRQWNRDAVVFHMEDWNNVGMLPPAVEFKAEDAPTIMGVDPRRGSLGGAPDEGVEDVSADESAPIMEKVAPQSAEPDERGLKPGVRFSIKFGPKDWTAVYWSKDELGDIVVHDTNKIWTAMHLNLNRFKESLELKGSVSMDEMKTIQQHLDGQA
jgi:hypothetical protein